MSKESVSSLAREALLQAGGDRARAATLLADRARADADLYRDVMDGSLDARCWELIRLEQRRFRDGVWQPGNEAVWVREGETQRPISRGSLYLYPLPNGCPLGNARLGDLDHAIATHRQLERGNARAKRWFLLIREHVTDELAVRDALTEGALEELRADAKGRVA